MREIKIRGFSKEKLCADSQWVEGFGVLKSELAEGGYDCLLLTPHGEYDVFRKSVGQYTGLNDRNGKDIFEGDIIRIASDHTSLPAEVTFDDGCFCVIGYLGDLRTYPVRHYLFSGYELEVIGNKVEHPHLLEESK